MVAWRQRGEEHGGEGSAGERPCSCFVRVGKAILALIAPFNRHFLCVFASSLSSPLALGFHNVKKNSISSGPGVTLT